MNHILPILQKLKLILHVTYSWKRFPIPAVIAWTVCIFLHQKFAIHVAHQKEVACLRPALFFAKTQYFNRKCCCLSKPFFLKSVLFSCLNMFGIHHVCCHIFVNPWLCNRFCWHASSNNNSVAAN